MVVAKRQRKGKDCTKGTQEKSTHQSENLRRNNHSLFLACPNLHRAGFGGIDKVYKGRVPRWVQASPLWSARLHALRVYYQCLLNKNLICNPQTEPWKLHTLLTYLSTYLLPTTYHIIYLCTFPSFTFYLCLLLSITLSLNLCER